MTIVTGVNRDLCRMSSVVPLASLFLARLDPATGRLDYCSAGHPPALLLRADGKSGIAFRRRSAARRRSLLLPLLGDAVELRAGDVLLAYSDGILESRNNAIRNSAMSASRRNCARARAASAEAVLFSVLGAVQDFAAASPLADDMSLVVVRRDAAQGNV